MPSSTSLPSLDEALAIYKRTQKVANYAFFKAKIEHLESNPDLTDLQRLNRLAPCFDMGKWRAWGPNPIIPPSDLLIEGRDVSFSSTVFSDGAGDPAPPEEIDAYFEKLLPMLNDIAGYDVGEPEEFRQLLQRASYIQGSHYEQNNVGSMSMEELKPHDVVNYDPSSDREWVVMAAFRCGYGYDTGVTWIALAKKDEGTTEEQVLKWRVYSEGDIELDDGMWFSSIAEYLLFKCKWLERLPEGWEKEQVYPTPHGGEFFDEDDGDEEEEEEDEAD